MSSLTAVWLQVNGMGALIILISPLSTSLMQIRRKRGFQVSFFRKVHPSSKRNQQEKVHMPFNMCCGTGGTCPLGNSLLDESWPFPSNKVVYYGPKCEHGGDKRALDFTLGCVDSAAEGLRTSQVLVIIVWVLLWHSRDQTHQSNQPLSAKSRKKHFLPWKSNAGKQLSSKSRRMIPLHSQVHLRTACPPRRPEGSLVTCECRSSHKVFLRWGLSSRLPVSQGS